MEGKREKTKGRENGRQGWGEEGRRKGGGQRMSVGWQDSLCVSLLLGWPESPETRLGSNL